MGSDDLIANITIDEQRVSEHFEKKQSLNDLRQVVI
jgi:hypothetical protein